MFLVLQCPVLTKPNNGDMSGTGRDVGSLRSFSCNAGYDMIGSNAIVCQVQSGTAKWSGTVPICQGKPS